MSLFSSNRQKPKRYFYVTGLVGALLIAAAIFFLQQTVLTRTAERVLPLLAARAGLDLQWDRLQVGLFAPMTMEGVRIWDHSADGGATSLRVRRAVWEFSSLWRWWEGKERIFSEARMEGVEGILDFRAKEFSNGILKNSPRLKLMILPWVLKIQAPDINLLFDGVTYRFRNFSADLSEDSLGAIQYSVAKVETPVFEKTLPFSSALATWKSGTLGIVKWPLLPGCVMQLMNLNFLDTEGLELDFSMAAFGGTLKGSLRSNGVRPYWDAALVAQQIELGSLAMALDIRAPVRGILKEGKLTFRGEPGNISDAEASLHISAEDFHWSNLGWQTLECGVDLINHRIAISEFHLRQKENFLLMNGSATIPQDLRNLSKTPFEISILGNIQNLEALAGLLGPKFQQLHGRMTLDGSLWSGNDGPNGYFKLEASSIQFQDVQFTSARLNTIFQHGNVDVTSCELWNGEDFLTASGTLNLNAFAYQYSGKLSLRTREISAYRALMEKKWQKQLQSGGGELTWQGDGTLQRHSGAFTLRMDRLVSAWTPGGVTGNLTGTFSPDNISLDSELWQGPLRLTTQMALSPLGVQVRDLRVNKGITQLARGTAFFPIDLFAIANGAPWKNALRPEKPAFLDLGLKKIELSDLWHLTGQNIAFSGSLEGGLSVRENPTSFNFEGYLFSDALQGQWRELKIPLVQTRINVGTAGGNVMLMGSLASQKLGKIRGDILLPLNPKKTSFAQPLNLSGPIRGSLQVEKLDISTFKFLFSGLNQLAGTAKANFTFKNTLADPRVDGWLALKEGSLKFAAIKTPPILDAQVVASIKDNHVTFDTWHGKLGDSPFLIKGGLDFSKLDEPWCHFQLTGNRLLLYQDPDLSIRANVNLSARGYPHSGKIFGTVRFQDSELHRRVEIGSIVPNTSPQKELFSGKNLGIPATLARWGLDVSIFNAAPFLVKARLTNGEIIPRLHLGGHLGEILPSGSIEFKNLRAFFPFAIADIPNGRVFFDPKYPQEALVDAQGSIDAAGYSLRMTAAGSLIHPSLFFDADPPLSQQCISLLLLTGQSPCPNNLEIGAYPKIWPAPMLRALRPVVSPSSGLDILPFSFMKGRTLYEFPGTSSDYLFRLVR